MWKGVQWCNVYTVLFVQEAEKKMEAFVLIRPLIPCHRDTVCQLWELLRCVVLRREDCEASHTLWHSIKALRATLPLRICKQLWRFNRPSQGRFTAAQWEQTADLEHSVTVYIDALCTVYGLWPWEIAKLIGFACRFWLCPYDQSRAARVVKSDIRSVPSGRQLLNPTVRHVTFLFTIEWLLSNIALTCIQYCQKLIGTGCNCLLLLSTGKSVFVT